MPRPDKRSSLTLLTDVRLRQLAENFELHTKTGLQHGELVELLASSKRVAFESLLRELKRAELKEICRHHGLDDGGKAKTEIVVRIFGGGGRRTIEPGGQMALPLESVAEATKNAGGLKTRKKPRDAQRPGSHSSLTPREVSSYGRRAHSPSISERITQVLPREQAGIQTGRKYEVQYEEAALSCLKLLEEGDATCVYCEWHDDFVVERQSSTKAYAFHQVKTRSDAKGAWSIAEILGVKNGRAANARKPKSKPKKGKKADANTGSKSQEDATAPNPVKLELRKGKSIAYRMLDHYRKFADACAVFVLVTPVDVAAEPLLALVDASKTVTGPAHLHPESRALFDALVAAYQQQEDSIVEADVWGLLTRLEFAQARASENDPRVAVGLMGQMIFELSEVNISILEQRQISEALLKVVRERAHTKIKALPTEEEVRARKAVSLTEVIKLLPLSFDGYERLKGGDRQAVKSLSRLQRLCHASGMSKRMIVQLCELKVEWQAWRTAVGDSLTTETLGALRESGLALLAQLASRVTPRPYQDLLIVAEQEATRLAALPRMPSTITRNVLMGLVFALAAEKE